MEAVASTSNWKVVDEGGGSRGKRTKMIDTKGASMNGEHEAILRQVLVVGGGVYIVCMYLRTPGLSL